MKDTIYRQDAINAIDCDIVITGRKNAELVAETIAMFADRIKSLPSVEPKIIRCKDCKWWWQREVKINLCPGGGLLTDGEWFCGNAERIDDE